MTRSASAATIVFGASMLAAAAVSMHARQMPAPAGEWRQYSGDNASRKYSPLDQINKNTVSRLHVAWRRPHIDPRLLDGLETPLRLSNNFRSTPIMAGSVLYASNAVGLVEAFDPATGRTLWVQTPGDDPMRPTGGNRGVALWSDGAEQRILAHRNQYLYALDPKT